MSDRLLDPMETLPVLERAIKAGVRNLRAQNLKARIVLGPALLYALMGSTAYITPGLMPRYGQGSWPEGVAGRYDGNWVYEAGSDAPPAYFSVVPDGDMPPVEAAMDPVIWVDV